MSNPVAHYSIVSLYRLKVIGVSEQFKFNLSVSSIGGNLCEKVMMLFTLKTPIMDRNSWK